MRIKRRKKGGGSWIEGKRGQKPQGEDKRGKKTPPRANLRATPHEAKGFRALNRKGLKKMRSTEGPRREVGGVGAPRPADREERKVGKSKAGRAHKSQAQRTTPSDARGDAGVEVYQITAVPPLLFCFQSGQHEEEEKEKGRAHRGLAFSFSELLV